MLRALLALISSLQFGEKLKRDFRHSLRQAAVLALAALLLFAAACFGLFAAYQALVLNNHFTPAEAAGLIAVALLFFGALLIAALPLFDRRAERRAKTSSNPLEALGLLDEDLGKTMQQISPLTLLAIAFLAGLFAGRR
jgi:hypothetical protein